MIDSTMSGAFHSSSIVIVFHSNSAERIPGTSPAGAALMPANLDPPQLDNKAFRSGS